jgi:hypothetical protein
LVTPVPFGSGNVSLPDPDARARDLALYAESIRELARERKLSVLDIHREFLRMQSEGDGILLENDGLQLSPSGHARLAGAWMIQLGFPQVAAAHGAPAAKGEWRSKEFEQLQRLAIEKDRIWFDYYRPQNWAFLGGDRTSQPSSRDHLNPSVRWFPTEMEKFLPLLEAKERELWNQAKKIGGAQ